jgi:hypothetical protein
MKSRLIFLLLLTFSVTLSAQDTIFVKNGNPIPAVIVEKNSTEVQYKKFGQPEPAAIYSLFVSDIISIHYRNGIIADYTQAGKVDENKPLTAYETAGTMRTIRISVGAGADNFYRNSSDPLLEFWRYHTGNNDAVLGWNSVAIPVSIKTTFVIGASGRNWLGDELQIVITPKDAINASAFSGTTALQLHNNYVSIILFYGHTLNHKRTVAALLEPGLDLSMMNGYFKFGTDVYDVALDFGTGFHIATGLDWIISKRFTANCRFGYRTMKTKEMHKDETSSTGYSSFYVTNKTDGDLLTINWNGPYISAGLNLNFYVKLKGVK